MASIKQYSNSKGTFYEVYAYGGVDELTGKQINLHKKGFKTEKAAAHWAESARVEVRSKGLPNRRKTKEQAKITYQDVYDMWVEQYIYQVKPSTYIKTTAIFRNHILPEFGECFIGKITPHLCQKAVNGWREKLVNFGNVFQYLRKIFLYAIEHEIIEKNPCDKVKIPKAIEDIEAPEEDGNFFSKEELNTFLEACKADQRSIIYPFFRLLAYTGLRRGEILALRWSDINLKERHLTVARAVTLDLNARQTIGTPKNKSSRRTISIDQETAQVLLKWKNRQRDEMFMLGYNTLTQKDQLAFSNGKNLALNNARPIKWLRQLCKAAEVKTIGLHGLRHTHCTLLLEAGVNIKEVQHRLGHSDIETTLKIYAHINDKRKDLAVKEFAKYLAN